MRKNLLLTAIACCMVFASCEKDSNLIKNEFTASGLYILNEGNFGSGNGDVSFYSLDSQTVINNLSLNANGFSAGDVVQDMLIHDTLAVVVVNNSNKVRVFKLNTFEWIKDISIDQPRHIIKVSDSLAYVSTWLGDVRILNLSALDFTGTITLGNGPEGMVAAAGKVYAAISPGNDYVNNTNTVKVIRISDRTVIKTVQVGWNPLRLAYSAEQGKVYVACSGKDYVSPKVPGGIYVISVPEDQVVDSLISVDNNGLIDSLYPGRITLRGNEGYFISGFYGAALHFNLSSLAITDTLAGLFYNVAVNPIASDDQQIYCTDASTLPGKLKIYSSARQLVDEVTVGDFPSGIVFRSQQ